MGEKNLYIAEVSNFQGYTFAAESMERLMYQLNTFDGGVAKVWHWRQGNQERKIDPLHWCLIEKFTLKSAF